ncbi:PAS domain S-box protein [Gracilimonas tropica]|uniref:sensor histidine kinase n=1 Tax=Gracilimonas tropica TaxID=454600 RepID=UPI0003798586|nr:PAS domain S-box protein [Gracilimonas tropica]
MRRIPKLLELNALSITLFYLVFAILWILLSDQFLVWITQDPELISRLQTIKGVFYVLITAGFLFYLINLSNERITAEKDKIDKALSATKTATWYLDLNSLELTYSNHFHNLFGVRSKKDFKTLKEYAKLINYQDREKALQELQKVMDGGSEGFNIDFRVNWGDDKEHWLRCNSTKITDTEEDSLLLAGVLMDVTRQKELERKYAREKELFESIFEHIPVMLDVTTEDLEVIRVNKAYEEITGWKEREILSENIMDKVYPDPEVREEAKKAMEKADGTWFEFQNYTKEGEKRIQQWANIRLSDGTTIGIGLDVTDQKKLAREHERDRLELQKVYDNIPVFINLHNKEGHIYRVNKYFEEVMGYSNLVIKDISLEKEMFPEAGEAKRAQKHMRQADGSWQDFRIRTKEGDTIYTSWSNIRVTDEMVMGIGLDTTELKQKERELEELNSRYKSAEKLAKLGHWKRNLKTNGSVVSSGFYDIVELDPEQHKLTFDMLKEVIHEDDWDHFLSAVDEGIETGKLDFNYRVVGKETGKVKHIHELGRVEYDHEGEPATLNGTIQDITESIEYQKKLKEITERYRRAEEIAGFGHWYRNVQTDEVVWSDGFCEITGIEPEGDTAYEAMLDRIHPEDRDDYDAAFKEALQTGSLNVRYRLIKSESGEIGYFQELAQTEYDEKGNPVAISGTIQDMTEREEFQARLKERNDFIETTLENLPIGVAVNLIDSGKTTLMNSKFAEIYGWPKDTLADVDTFFEKIYPDEGYRQKMTEMIMADVASKDPERMHWRGVEVTTETGEKKIINAKNIPVYDQNLMISTVVDVTAQAEAERRLAESEHNYRLLFQKSPQPMWIFNPDDYSFVEVNNAAVRHYGYSRKEFQEMTILDIRPENDREDVKKDISGIKAHELDENKEWRHLKKNGDLIYVTIAGSDIDYFGNRYRLILVNDITNQKKAEEMVLASLVEGENKERARIARELHDGLGQYLAAANMNFDAVKNNMDQLDERRQKQFEKGLNLLKHAVTETAQISRNLLPRVVDDYGLALAIEALIDNYSNNTDINISYYHNVDKLDIPRKVELNLYRIAQEGISNAVKYSEATQINVQLIKDQLDLILSIDDNGKGFDMAGPDFNPGLGLQTIKTRSGALGGEFELDSKPGKGTYLHIIVPIEAPA